MHQTLPAAPTERTVPESGDGVRLHVRDWGGAPTDPVPAAPPLVLLHGLASNARIWDGVAAGLLAASRPSGMRVVAVDLRGHGESEQPDDGYDFPTVARDLEVALEALGIRRSLLVGHSWGANVALHYAAAGSPAADLAGLVLVDGAFQGISEWPGMSREMVRQRLAPPRFAMPLEDWLGQAGRWLAPGADPAQSWVREFLRAGVEVDGDGVARARFHFDNHMQVVDALYEQRPSALYPRVTCPVLLCPAGGQTVAGKREAVERVSRLLPDARVTWFEDAMHDIPLQRPLELAAELARFVLEVSDRG